MPKISAGLLMYRVRDGALEFFLAHPGGPFWKDRDSGAWTIPKGEIHEGEDPVTAAQREFKEEVGIHPHEPFIELTPIRQKGGKLVHAWAFKGDCDPSTIQSNTCKIEWPPGSGRFRNCPEVDRAAFFRIDEAKQKINPAQIPFLEELTRKISLQEPR